MPITFSGYIIAESVTHRTQTVRGEFRENPIGFDLFALRLCKRFFVIETAAVRSLVFIHRFKRSF